MTDIASTTTTAQASLTVTVDGVTKTFSVNAETTGDPTGAARGAIDSVSTDATNWSWELRKARREAAGR